MQLLLLLLFRHYVVSDSFVTLWTVAHQAPLSMGFPRQEHWSGFPFPSPGDFPNPGIKPALAGGTSPLNHRGSPKSEATLLQFHPWTWRRLTLFYWLSGSVWCQMWQCLYRFPLFLILRVDQDAREIWHLDLERKVLGVLVGDTNHLVSLATCFHSAPNYFHLRSDILHVYLLSSLEKLLFQK